MTSMSDAGVVFEHGTVESQTAHTDPGGCSVCIWEYSSRKTWIQALCVSARTGALLI